MRGGLSIAIVLAALLPASPVWAEDQEPILRCLAATGALASSPDKAAAQIGMMNSLYWLGRVDPSMTEAELEERLLAITTTMNRNALQAQLQRCGAELAERGAMMQRVGKKMQERAARGQRQ